MIHNSQNYSNIDPECNDGDHFIDCNLSQLLPHTSICSGKTGLRFTNCFMMNAIVPVDSQIFDCNQVQIDRCYWVQLVEGENIVGLPIEPENCRHVIDTDEIIIDGATVVTEYIRQETVL